MSLYDSDDEYDAACVTLGYADGEVLSVRDAADWRLSRVGGLPIFPALHHPPDWTTFARCSSCGALMALLCQVYCAHENSPYERVLYVFGCIAETCRRTPQSVRCYSLSVDTRTKTETPPKQPSPAAPTDLGRLIFGSPVIPKKGNPFAPAPVPAPAAAPKNPFALKPAPEKESAVVNAPLDTSTTSKNAPIISINKSKQEESLQTSPSIDPTARLTDTLTKTKITPPPSLPFLRSFYISTCYESPYETNTLPTSTQGTLDGLDDDSGHHNPSKGAGGRQKKSGGSKAAWSDEKYEVQRLKGVTDVFLNFQERISWEYEQCIRYELGGSPLPFSAESRPYQAHFKGLVFRKDTLPCCPSCAAPRVFEMQLMPRLVSIVNDELKKTSSSRCATDSAAAPPNVQDTPSDITQVLHNTQTTPKLDDDSTLDFATAWIFVCPNECGVSPHSDLIREELVLLEFEEL